MPKPFGQLLRTPNNYYFYDPNTNQTLPISRQVYSYIETLMRETSDGLSESSEIQHLREDGILPMESVVKKIQHPYSKYLGLLLNRRLHGIILQTTQNCNLRCKYCIYSESKNVAQRSHSAKSMSWETAKHAIDFLWERSVDNDSVSIGFYGGEPLLKFDLIKDVVAYSKTRLAGKDVRYHITSNGTLLTDEITGYLQKNNINLMISIDGPQEIHDKNRVFAGGGGTYETVMQNIERLKQIAPEYFKTIRFSMVIDPTNDFDCINSISLGADTITRENLMPSLVDKEFDDEVVIASEEYLQKYEYHAFLAYLSYINRYPKEKVSPISYQSLINKMGKAIKMQDSPILQPMASPGGPCIPGQLRLFCNITGDLFPCERVSEKSPAMRIGNLDEGFYVDKALQLLNIGQLGQEKCKNCWSFRYCTVCAKKADNNELALSEKRKFSCCADSRAAANLQLQDLLFLREIGEYYPDQIRTQRERCDN